MATKKKKVEALTENEIREDSVPEGVVEVNAEAEEPKKSRPPKDYVEKALDLLKKQREGDDSRELFVAEQNLVEALRFIEKHEKKGGA